MIAFNQNVFLNSLLLYY